MPSVSVNPPKTPATKGSNGVAAATVPNICKMPGPPAPFVPTPLPNIGRTSLQPKGYTKRVKIEGQPVAVRGASFGSQGDMASKGTGGGIVSANVHGPAKFIGTGSLDVMAEGKNIHLLGDPVLNNCAASGAPANAATMGGLVQGICVTFRQGAGDPNCPHPNITRSDPALNQKKKRRLEQEREHYATKSESLFRRAGALENQGKHSLAKRFLDKAIEAENQARTRAFEQKVASDTSAREQSVDYYCSDCGLQGELDCITESGVIKEVKIRGGAVCYKQFEKHCVAAATLFPGAAVHAAVPKGDAKKVTDSVARSCIQEH